MSIRKDSEDASKQLDDYLYPNGKKPFDRKRFRPEKIYENLEPISNDEWSEVSKEIRAKGMAGIGLLPKFRSNYEAGYYPSKEEFIETLNALYENLFKCWEAKENQSPTDNEMFDDLLEDYNDALNQRTWNYSTADKLLRHKAFKVQKRIEMYLEKKVKAGETLTDEMINFQNVDELETLKKFPPPDEYIPPTLDVFSKTKEKYSVRYKVPSKEVPTHYF